MHSFFHKKPTMGEALVARLQNYQVVWWVPRPPFLLHEDKSSTLNHLQNILANIRKESLIDVYDIVFCSWKSVSIELKELTRSEDNFISAIKIIMPKKDLILHKNFAELGSLPQPFQAIHAVLPPQAGFNSILQIEEKLIVNNPIYKELDNSEGLQASLVQEFFEEKTHPENQLRIRCLLEQMQVDISDTYWKLVEEDKKIEALEKIAPTLGPPLLNIIRSYLTGIPTLIRK